MPKGKKSDTIFRVEASSQIVKSFHCDQCDHTFENKTGLKIHMGKTHKNTIPHTDGHKNYITADVAVQTSNVKNNDSKDFETQTKSTLKKVYEAKVQDT